MRSIHLVLSLPIALALMVAACLPVGRGPADGGGAAQGATAAPSAADSSSSCVTALDSMAAIIRRDHPGYRDRVRGREGALAALTDSVRAVARTSDHYAVCIPALNRWARFFQDAHLLVWQAAPPSPPSDHTASPSDAPANDPARPVLTFVDDSTAVLRIPDLAWSYKAALDSFLAAHRVRLLVTPYLVVDVRENGGGGTCTYESLTPLLYTGPIREAGADVWTSAANVAVYREGLVTDGMPEDVKAQIRATLPRMEAHPNRFVPWTADTVIRLDTVYPMPRAVAVLVDRGCASSCEDFVLAARQSRKVTVLGAEPTAGLLDYGNVRSVWLPGWRRLRVPTTRSHRLPAKPLDFVGLAPAVRIPLGEPDVVTFARHYLRSTQGTFR